MCIRDRDKVADYLKRKEVEGADMALVAALIKKGAACREKIAEPQKEKKLDEEISIELSGDRMQAFLTLHAGEEGGKTMSVEEVLDQMGRIYKVKAGVDEEQIAFMLEGKMYGQKILVAKGKPAVDGENGKLTFHFSMDDFLKVDEEREDRIDFRNVMKFEKTEEKQVLVSRSFATPGSDGYDVLGTRLPAKRGKDVSLPAGKNVLISEDKSQLTAKISGKASYIGGKVSVLPHVKTVSYTHLDVYKRQAMMRMMQDVPDADVVITNPTQYAVALKYDDAKYSAPIILAKRCV